MSPENEDINFNLSFDTNFSINNYTKENNDFAEFYMLDESLSPSLSTSSLSQDEIFEEIQRECAEIEEQHSSGFLLNSKVFFCTK